MPIAPLECRWIRVLIFGALLLFAGAAGAQQLPTISFTFDFPGSIPSHYVVTVSSDGSATYESAGNSAKQSESDDGFGMEFTMSPEVRARIFELARKADYFRGNLETRKRNVASTGSKTLAYRDSERSGSAIYNYSPLAAVQELTRIFQDLSATLEFGQRLEYDYKYQKLALDEDLKRMEELAGQGELEELSAVSPVLRKITNDPSVMNVVRVRAQRLIARSASPAGK